MVLTWMVLVAEISNSIVPSKFQSPWFYGGVSAACGTITGGNIGAFLSQSKHGYNISCIIRLDTLLPRLVAKGKQQLRKERSVCFRRYRL